MEIPEQCVKYVQSQQQRHQNTPVFFINFEQISHTALVFPALILNK